MNAPFKPVRTMGPEPGKIFFAMPYRTKKLANGQTFDFDEFYHEVCVPLVRDTCGMEPVRVDEIFGPQGVLETVWRAMQQAHIVIVDFTTRSANVAFELGWALLLGKRIIVLTQEPEDIPTDVKGLYRYIPYSPMFTDMQRMRTELALQVKALSEEPTEEMALMPMPGGGRSSVTARVIFVDREYVVVQDESGRRGVMGNGDVDYSRIIKDMAKWFKVGDRVDGAFVVDPMLSEMRYTLLGGETNPWPLLAGRRAPGTTFRSTVHSVVSDVGLFVKVDMNINGLVPFDQVPVPPPEPGAEVEVTVVRIDAEQRRVGLRLNRVLSAAGPGAEGILSEVGWRGYGRVVKAVAQRAGRGGFILLQVGDAARPAMLLAKDMSADLLADLDNNHVEIGEEILVEVVRVDHFRGKVLLKELPDEEDAPTELAAAA